MCKKHQSVLLNACGVDLETGFVGQPLTEHHCEKGWDVSFAGSRNTFVVQLGKGYTAGILNGCEQIEATERNAL